MTKLKSFYNAIRIETFNEMDKLYFGLQQLNVASFLYDSLRLTINRQISIKPNSGSLFLCKKENSEIHMEFNGNKKEK